MSVLNDPAKVCFWTTRGHILDFKRACLNNNTDMSAVLRQAMIEFIERDQKKRPDPGHTQQAHGQGEGG